MVDAKRYPVDQKMIPEFTSDNGITLINVQKDQSAFLMGKQFDHKFNANLHQYTEIAIETLEGELKNKNIAVEPNAEKKLYEDDYRRLKRAVFEDMINKSNFTEFDKEKYIEAWSQPGAILGGVNYYRANTSFDEWTGIIEVPTLVIWGMKDVALLPQQLEGLSDYVINLKIVRSENSSHWITNDDPDLIVSSITEFVLD